MEPVLQDEYALSNLDRDPMGIRMDSTDGCIV